MVRVEGVFVPPPEPTTMTAKVELEPPVRQIDFALRDAMNRRLGEMGGRRVVDLEKRRLLAAGRDDLTGKLGWVSNTSGNGLGYDIVSFGHECGDELHLEVKTTTLGRHFPFMVSANEVRVSAREPDAYMLYRVFGFSREPKVYVLKGAIEAACRLAATMYRATI